MQRISFGFSLSLATTVLLAGFLSTGAAEDNRESGADETWAASLRLRGGYDGDPTLGAGGKRPSAFAGLDAAVIAGRETTEQAAALTLESSSARYQDGSIAPLQEHKVRLDLANKDQGGISLKLTTAAEYQGSHETRAFDLYQSARVKAASGPVRPFLTGEVRAAALNETNPISGDFFPEPQRFLRGTLIPGVALHRDDFEIGVSVNLSATRYADELDFFGFRRDNERIQPFLFARYRKDKLSVFAAVSRLHGDWHDADFSDVRATLFEASLNYDGEPFAIELAAARTATDTTLPLSPVSIDTSLRGRAEVKFDRKTAVSVFGSHVERELLDSPFRIRMTRYGIGFEREFAKDSVLGLELARVRASPIAGPVSQAVVATASLTRRFGEVAEKGAGGMGIPPAERMPDGGGPAMRGGQ